MLNLCKINDSHCFSLSTRGDKTHTLEVSLGTFVTAVSLITYKVVEEKHPFSRMSTTVHRRGLLVK